MFTWSDWDIPSCFETWYRFEVTSATTPLSFLTFLISLSLPLTQTPQVRLGSSFWQIICLNEAWPLLVYVALQSACFWETLPYQIHLPFAFYKDSGGLKTRGKWGYVSIPIGCFVVLISQINLRTWITMKQEKRFFASLHLKPLTFIW